MTTNTEFQDQGWTAPTTPPAAASDNVPMIRFDGDSVEAVVQHLLTAGYACDGDYEDFFMGVKNAMESATAPPIAQQGGVEVTDAMVDVYQRCYMQNFVDGRMLKVPERIKRSIQAALASKADGGES